MVPVISSDNIFSPTGANPCKSISLKYIAAHPDNLFIDHPKTGIQLNEHYFFGSQGKAAKAFVNANHNENGFYSCIVTCQDTRLSISQSDWNSKHIVICDLQTKEQMQFIDAPFPELQKKIFKRYIKERSELGNVPVDLSEFDLDTFTDLSDVDFTNTILSRQNVDAIIKGGGSLARATIAAGEDVADLYLEGVALDKTMADSLINAGADFKSVLVSYLTSRPCVASSIYKATMLKAFLETERKNGKVPIDLSEFDLSDVNFKGIDFAGTLLSKDNLRAIIAGSGNLTGATLADNVTAARLHSLDNVGMDKSMATQLITAGANPRAVLVNYLATERNLGHIHIDISGINLTGVDMRGIDLHDIDLYNAGLNGVKLTNSPLLTEQYQKRVQANFESDFLTMLTMFSQTVAAAILKSPSWDFANHMPTTKYGRAMHYVRQYEGRQSIEAAFKASTGNCGEMAAICKSMIDLYFEKSFKPLGYQDFSFKSSCIISLKPSSHVAVMVTCVFQGIKRCFIVDPWSDGGKAWTYQNGLDYFHQRTPDRYTQPGITFVDEGDKNDYLEMPSTQTALHAIFNNFGMDKQLNSTIKKHKLQFVGLPMA